MQTARIHAAILWTKVNEPRRKLQPRSHRHRAEQMPGRATRQPSRRHPAVDGRDPALSGQQRNRPPPVVWAPASAHRPSRARSSCIGPRRLRSLGAPVPREQAEFHRRNCVIALGRKKIRRRYHCSICGVTGRTNRSVSSGPERHIRCFHCATSDTESNALQDSFHNLTEFSEIVVTDHATLNVSQKREPCYPTISSSDRREAQLAFCESADSIAMECWRDRSPHTFFVLVILNFTNNYVSRLSRVFSNIDRQSRQTAVSVRGWPRLLSSDTGISLNVTQK
jgi:hypothetical protein